MVPQALHGRLPSSHRGKLYFLVEADVEVFADNGFTRDRVSLLASILHVPRSSNAFQNCGQ